MCFENFKFCASRQVFCFCIALRLLNHHVANAQTVQSTLHYGVDPIIESIDIESEFFGYQSAVNRDFTGGQLAYDYSVNVFFDQSENEYRMYSGGRWIGAGPGGSGDGDHILQHTSSSGLGNTWSMPHNRPEFLQGQEEGFSGQWYSRNYLEPEVLKLDDTYYMYSQVQVVPGDPIDIPGQTAVTGADRIQLHTSTDGDNWTRWSTQSGNPNRGVIVNLDDPTRTSLHHQEVVYVPWDEDDKPYWMYVAANVNDVFTGYHRIRSDDPTTFDWQQRQVAGLAQLGNQIGYAKQAPGGPLFVRITFSADPTGRQVPSLQFSRNGLNWFWGDEGPVLLDGSKNVSSNKNSYFLGLSTLDGLGEIEYLGNNQYRAIYAASTSNTPIAPEIFFSEIGVGELLFTINGITSADFDQDNDVDGSDILAWQRGFGIIGGAALSDGDADGDGDVDDGDLDIWQSQFGSTNAVSEARQVVPEPTMFALLSVASLLRCLVTSRCHCAKLS